MTSIIVSSELCKDTYPNNTGGEFTNYLNHPINATSVALTEIYYTPYMWFNVRKTYNYVLLKLSQVQLKTGEYISSPELKCTIEPGYYVDEQDLIEKILIAINLEIFNYFVRVGANSAYYDCEDPANSLWSKYWYRDCTAHVNRTDWLQRKGQYMRAHPQWFQIIDDGNYWRSETLKGGKREVYEVPPNWDVNLLDGRWLGAVLIGGKVVFKPRNINFFLSFAFCKELAYILGATPIMTSKLVWFSNPPMTALYSHVNSRIHYDMVYDSKCCHPVDGSIRNNRFHEGPMYTPNAQSKYRGAQYIVWHVYIDHDITVGFPIDLSRNTVGSIWVCCNIIEQTNIGHDVQLPLLRCIPSESGHGTHTNHCFVEPQYCKVVQSQVESCKIWLLEEASTDLNVRFDPLNINGDVHVRLEFQNAK
jgi:hypothetical protein